MTIRTLVLGAALGLSLVALGARIEATPNEATIPLDDVAAVWVKQHDDSWISYIGGAPDIVNESFFERYAPHLLATPTPEPTTEMSYGFTTSGEGGSEEEVPVEGSGALVCRASVMDNYIVERSGREVPVRFRVSLWGTGVRMDSYGPGLERYRKEIVVGAPRAYVMREGEIEPSVIHFSDSSEPRRAFTPPYSLAVSAASRASWTVSCEPPAPLPSAQGFTISGVGDSSGRDAYSHIRGDGVIDIEADVSGRLVCFARRQFTTETMGPGGQHIQAWQWAVWGRDENDDPRTVRMVGTEPRTIWFGDARPGEWAAFRPPYGVEVWGFPGVPWTVTCEAPGQ